MTPVGYLRLVSRGWWIPVLAAVAAAAVAFLLASREPPVYRARASFIVSPAFEWEESDEDIVYKLQTLDRATLLPTFAEIFNSRDLHREAASSVPSLSETGMRGYSASAVVLPRAHVIRISVLGPDPAVAAALANAIGERARTKIRGLYRPFKVRPLEAARPPRRPIEPQPSRDAVLAASLGLLAGLLLALAWGWWKSPT